MEKITLSNLLKLNKSDLVNKTIIFPTDTVYGVACLLDDKVGIEKIYNMKKRDHGKPIAVLVSSVNEVENIGIINDNIRSLYKYWPGALTIIVNRKNSNNTIALRIPNSSISLDILSYFGPMHTTSVNYSGEKEINDINEIYDKFHKYCDYLVIDKQEFSSIPSTIVDCTNDEYKVIRQGSIVIK